MAIDLKAVFSVQDRGSRQLRIIARNIRQLENALNGASGAQDRFTDANDRLIRSLRRLPPAAGQAGNSLRLFGNSMRMATNAGGTALRMLNPLSLALGGIASSAAAAYGAMKIFNATVGSAMEYEQAEVTIKAMFNDDKASAEYMKMVSDLAIKSPLFDSQTMLNNSKTFVSLTKDVKMLEKMWKLSELLGASDPIQGVEGAVFSLRELFSGDSTSMVGRFEMPKSEMNRIKKLDLADQVDEMTKLLNKMGFTDRLINDMGNTALGKITQVKERMALLLSDIGMPSVNVVADFMDDILSRFEGQDIKKFANWGANIMKGIVSGVSNASIQLYDYLARLFNDPKFKEITTITGKILFVVDDIADKFQAWWAGGGEAKIIAFGSTVAQVLVAALDATPLVADIGAKMGAAIWQGILSGVKASAAASPVGSVLGPLLSGINTGLKFLNDPFGVVSKSKNKFDQKHGGGKNSHYHGIDSVPYNGYQATLHEGERVLTRQENNEYSQSRNNSSVAINIASVNITNDMDVNRFATLLANEIERKVSVGV